MNLWISTSHINSTSFPTFCLLTYDRANFRARSVWVNFVRTYVNGLEFLFSCRLKSQISRCSYAQGPCCQSQGQFSGRLQNYPSLRLRCHRVRVCRWIRGLRVSYSLWRVGLHSTPFEMPCDNLQVCHSNALSAPQGICQTWLGHIYWVLKKLANLKFYLFVLRQLNFTLAQV